jgi:hypothetical protein
MHRARIHRYDFEGVFELLNYAKEFRIDSKAPVTRLRNLHPRKGQWWSEVDFGAWTGGSWHQGVLRTLDGVSSN